MKRTLTISALVHEYELRAQKIEDNYEDREKWGHGAYDKHELALVHEFLGKLQAVKSTEAWAALAGASMAEGYKAGIEAADNWIKRDQEPETDGLYLITVLDMSGEKSEKKVRAAYYTKSGGGVWLLDFAGMGYKFLAWQELPAPYEGGIE